MPKVLEGPPWIELELRALPYFEYDNGEREICTVKISYSPHNEEGRPVAFYMDWVFLNADGSRKADQEGRGGEGSFELTIEETERVIRLLQFIVSEHRALPLRAGKCSTG